MRVKKRKRMALFGKKKKEAAAPKKHSRGDHEERRAAEEGAPESEARAHTAAPAVAGGGEDLARVLIRPRVTEKATIGTADNVYVFDVAPDANKTQIKHAVKKVYNVDPVKVHVSKIARKNVRSLRDGTKGVKGGGKKAYVYLKKGDSISVM